MRNQRLHPLRIFIHIISILSLCHIILADSCHECQPGTVYINNSCVICPTGQYCPGNCNSARLCPVGTYSEKEYQKDITTCTSCPAGTYSLKAGASECTKCPEGYYCPTTTASPIICPVGYFCEAQSVEPLECPSGSFSSLPGQAYCTSCGSTSTSIPGSSQCKCIGENRVHMNDGTCRCKAGFVSPSDTHATSDGKSDCEQLIYTSCNDGYVRNALGQCIDPNDPNVCDTECNHINVELSHEDMLMDSTVYKMKSQLRGSYDVNLGTCVCKSIDAQQFSLTGDISDIPRLTVSKSNANNLYNFVLTDSIHSSFYSADISKLSNVYAPSFYCNANDCQVHTATVSNSQHVAHIGISNTLAKVVGYDQTSVLNKISTLNTVELTVSENDLATPLTMHGAQPMSVKSIPTIQAKVSYKTADITGITNAVLCLSSGSSVLWHLEDNNYPVYAANHAYNNGVFDYSAFIRLQKRVNAGIPTSTFIHTFTNAGTYVFTNNMEHSPLIIRVMPKNVMCPTEYTVASSINTDITTSLEIIRFLSTGVDPDLDIIYILIAIFLGVSFLLTIFSKLTQYQARRSKLLFELPNDTVARQNFRKLQQDLQQQQSDHKILFASEAAEFRRECDRIAAETEQIKALLSIKITDSAGFLRAARHLIMAESTARGSHDHTQSQLERKIIHHIADLTTAIRAQLDEEVSPDGTTLPRANERMCILGAELACMITELSKNSTRELARRELMVNNSGIIGADLVKVMNQKQPTISELEGKLVNRLTRFREYILEPRINDIITMDTTFAARGNELRKQRNKAIVRSICLGFKSEIDNHARAILAALTGDDDSEVSHTILEPVTRELVSVRNAASNDVDQALLAVRRMINAATSKQKAAVFVGVPPELERALRLFLCQAGAAILGDNVIMNDLGLATEERRSNLDDAPQVDALQALVLDTLNEQPKSNIELTGDVDNDFELLLKSADGNLDPEQLKQLYSAYLKKNEMMEKIIADQKEQAFAQAQEMLSMEVSNSEDRAALEKATDLLRALMEQHEKEKQELTAKLNAEQEKEMEREINEQAARVAAENAKYEEERKRLEKELEEKRRNMISGSDEEHAAIAEHLLKIKQLDENMRDDQSKHQQALKDKHAQWKLKRQRDLDALKAKQKSELKEQEKEYQDTIASIKNNGEDNVVAGVDIAALAARIDGVGSLTKSQDYDDGEDGDMMEDDEETRAERRRMLEEHALQKKLDLQREHDEMKRRLEAELERERLDKLRELEEEAERRRLEALQNLADNNRELEQLEQQIEEIDQSELDDEERKRLLAKYRKEKEDLERQLNAEEAAQRAKLDASLRARAAQRQQMLQRKLEKEKEAAEKDYKELEKNLVQREKKMKEEELLSNVIAENNIDKSQGATIIENVMAERQKKELAELLKQQRADAAQKAKEMLDNAYGNLLNKKQELKAAKEEGQIDSEEEQRQLQALEVDVEKIRKQIEQEIKDKHERELAEAKEQFNKEIKDVYAKIYGDDAAQGLDLHRWEDKKELERKLREAEERKRAEEEEIKRKQAEVEAEIARMKEEAELARQEKLKEEMQRVEELMKRDQEDMQKRLQEQEEKARLEKEKALAERERQLKEEQDAALDEAEREAILKRYNEDLESKLVQDELEKKRQMLELQKRLKARDEQRKALAAKRAQDKVRKELEATEAYILAEQEKERLLQQEKELASKDSATKTVVLHKLLKAGKLQSVCRKAGVNGIVNVLKTSYKEEMENIRSTAEKLGEGNIVNGLNKMSLPTNIKQAFLASLPASEKLYVGDSGEGMSHTAVAGVLDGLQDMISSVIGAGTNIDDSLETELAKSHGKDTRIHPNDLNLREFMALRYAQWIADIACDANMVPSISICAASVISEPPSYRGRCLYKHSYSYEASTRVIYVHKSRLLEIGTLSSMVTMAVAHVAANSWMDTSKHYIEAYQKASQTLFRELFWAKSHTVQSELKIQPAVTPAHKVSCALSSKDPLSGHFEFVSGTNWHNAEAQWNALRTTFDKVAKEKKTIGLTNDVRVSVCEDVIGDYVDVRMKGDVSGWTALFKRLEAYKAFRETEQLRREVVQIEENIRYNLHGQDVAIAAAKGDIRVEDVDDDFDLDKATSDIAILYARRERLKNESDALHIDLIDIVTRSLEATRKYADYQKKLTQDSSTTLSSEETIAYNAVRDTIRRLAAARSTLMNRITDIEKQCERLNLLIQTPTTDEQKDE